MDIVEAKTLPMRELLERAQSGDESVLPQVRALLSNPRVLELLGGDRVKETEDALIRSFRPDDLLFGEVVRTATGRLRGELSGGDCSAMERILVDRTVLCWLQLHLIELAYARRSNPPAAEALLFEKKLSAANKRFLASVRTLATVRRLAVPVLIARIEVVNLSVDGV